MEFLKKYKLLFIVAAVLLLIISIGGAYLLLEKKADPNLVAVVDGKKIYNKDLNEFAYGIVMNGTPESPDLNNSGLNRSDILKILVESEVLESEAKDANVSVSDQDVKAYILKNYPDFDLNSDLYSQIFKYQRYLLLKEKVASEVQSVREGKYVFARDDIYFPDPEKEVTQEIQKKIDSNIEYSKKFIADLYSKIKSNEIAFENAIKIELNDPVIGENVPSENGSLHSGSFDSEDYNYKTGVMSHKEVREIVSKLNINEVSEPIYLSTEINGKKISIGWVIVKLEYSNGKDGSSFEDWLQDKLKSHKIEYKELT